MAGSVKEQQEWRFHVGKQCNENEKKEDIIQHFCFQRQGDTHTCIDTHTQWRVYTVGIDFWPLR